jgi:isoleucyl-tRNA synthetase/very-short-patch-repair endonuclease
MTRHYPEIDANPDFAALEAQVLSFWQREGIFAQSVAQRDPAKSYVFYDGPPFANGLPHYGHLLTGYVKDAVARYQTMRGHRVERRFGWDCHGLPAEMGAEKELGISGRAAITEYGIGKFNDYCRSSVMKYTAEWEYYVNRQGRWVDFKNDYKTMDKNFMESCLWAFKELWNKGLVYESMRVMPYSWAAETPVSNFETRIDNATRPREDKAAYVKFKLTAESADKLRKTGAPAAENIYLIAWTTTPWTLPSNLALAVGKGSVEYSYVLSRNGDCFICSSEYARKQFDAVVIGLSFDQSINSQDWDAFEKSYIQFSCDIESIINLTYEPLFPYFADTPNAFRILDGSAFVSDAEGTGIVHMAPGFGEDDQKCCAENGIEVIVPVDEKGRYTDAIFDIGWQALAADVSGSIPPYAAASSISSDAASSLSPPAAFSLSPPAGGGIQGGGRLGETPHSTRNPIAMARAEELRKNPTEVEKKLWEILSGKKVEGHKFRRQQSIGDYIVDFVCMEKRLVVEIDGGQHAESQKDYDEKRTAFLREQGYRVVRFWNHDVMQNLEGVVASIIEALAHPPVSPRQRGEEDKHASVLEDSGQRGEEDKRAYALEDSGQRGEEDARQKGDDSVLKLAGLNVIAEMAAYGEADTANHISEKDVAKFGLANMRILRWLKANGTLVKDEVITHNYPHCWRTDTPLIYRAMSSWYINLNEEVSELNHQSVKQVMAANNQQIQWIPDHVKNGQMGKGIESAPDWSISRNRFWGTPIPIWKSASGKIHVCGSIAEIEKLSGQKVADLHRPIIDDIVLNIDGEEYRRIEDVFDCWFESGAMPFAQLHYPFENKERFEASFPADFITEYIAQTRGWFYTLQVLSAALFGCAPFKNCICHGVVIDEETGLKYSKRLKNYKDPKEVMNQYGADALRWMMLASPVMRGADLAVDPDGKFIRDVVRLHIKPIWNAYNFFTLYANADGVKAKEIRASQEMMDRYIMVKCNDAVMQAKASLDAYDTPGACEAISGFFEVLNNWYIRRSKDRFWSEDKNNPTKQQAYDTLFTVLNVMMRSAAPLLPFTAEAVYRGLNASHPPEAASAASNPPQRGMEVVTVLSPPPAGGGQNLRQQIPGGGENISVHLQDFPKVREELAHNERQLVRQMDRARDLCNAILAIRSEENIRVRQPLSTATIYGADAQNYSDIAHIFKEETNIHNVRFVDDFKSVAQHVLTVNFPVAGKRLGGKMKEVGAAAKAGKWEYRDGKVVVADEVMQEGEYHLILKPTAAKGAKAIGNDAVVILDLTITPELEAEGLARDLVRMIQQARKDAGLNVSDRIALVLNLPESMRPAMQHQNYIEEQTLAVSIAESGAETCEKISTQEIDGEKITIGITKAA